MSTTTRKDLTLSPICSHAQGSHTFADLLSGYTDFLALCERENWTLNATKTMVGFLSCPFFGFVVDKSGTRLADKNLDPVRRMVPSANVPELRKTLGVFVRSSRFIPNYAHVVRPLTELTRSENGKPVPFTWTQARQASFDQVRNLLLDDIHLAPPTTAYLSTLVGTRRTTETERRTAFSSTMT
jgi:hypothetical protein